MKTTTVQSTDEPFHSFQNKSQKEKHNFDLFVRWLGQQFSSFCLFLVSANASFVFYYDRKEAFFFCVRLDTILTIRPAFDALTPWSVQARQDATMSVDNCQLSIVNYFFSNKYCTAFSAFTNPALMETSLIVPFPFFVPGIRIFFL